MTADGLKNYRMLDKIDEEKPNEVKRNSRKFLLFLKKELQDEVLSDEEYEFIKSYGGNLEHFWMETLPKDTGVEYLPRNFLLPSEVDIATDPNGQILEIATGNPSTIYVQSK